MMLELKPCPFCGSASVGGYSNAVFVGAIKIGYTVGVCCDNCRAMVISTDKDKSINDMIKVWNRRIQNVEVRQYGTNPTNITNCGELNINL